VGILRTNTITITDSAGNVRAKDLPLTMVPKNMPWELQVQGLVPVDTYKCASMGWASPVPHRTDYIVDQTTGTKYSMYSTVEVGQNYLRFEATKYSGVVP